MKISPFFFPLSLGLFFFAFAIGNPVFAQKGEAGIRLMPTFSVFDLKTSSGGTVSGNATLGFGAGVTLGYNFSQFVGIQGEVIYNTISQKYTEFDVEHKVKLNYLNIPVLLSLNTGKTKLVNMNLSAGPQIGISVGSKLEVSGTNPADSTQAVLSVKKGDLGVAYGAGLDVGMNEAKTIRFGFGFRGVLGLLDISDNSNSANTQSYYILDKANLKTYSGYAGVSFIF